MPEFVIKSRTTGPIVEATVDAETREHAIEETLDAAPQDGSEVEIISVTEIVPIANPPPPAEGAATQPAEAQPAAAYPAA